MNRTFRFIVGSLLTLVLLAPARLLAEEPALDLLRLVDAKAGLCLEVTNLKSRLPDLKRSELVGRLTASPFLQAWTDSRQYQRLQNGQAAIQQATQQPIGRFLADMFGESVIVAVYPVEGHETGDDTRFMLLTHAADRQVLDSTLEIWNRAEPQKSETLSHRGRGYIRRTRLAGRRHGDHVLYYATFGRTFVLTDSERLVRRAIELRGRAKKSSAGDGGDLEAPSLRESPVFKESRASISPESIASLYLNPRAWDEHFRAASEQSSLMRLLDGIWQRLDSVILGLRLDQGAVIEAVAHYDNSRTPQEWNEFLRRAAGTSTFLEKVPSRALVAAAGRWDLSGLDELLSLQQSESEEQEFESLRQIIRGVLLGHDLFDDVLPALGDDWGLYIVPPRESVRDCLPLEGLLGVSLPVPGAERALPGEKPGLRAALDNALNTGLNLLTAMYNQESPDKSAHVETEESEGLLMRWVANFGAYKPAYAITSNHLLLASTPQVIREFLDVEPEQTLLADDQFRRLRDDFFPNENQLLFVDVAGIRSLVERHRGKFLDHIAASESVSAEQADKELREFEAILDLLDSAFVAGSVNSERIRLVLGGVVTPRTDSR